MSSDGAAGRLIRLAGIGKCFDGRWVFRHLSLDVPERGIVAVTGASGSEKTTLARIAMGLTAPSEGTVLHRGGLRASILFPEDRLLPHLTIDQNLRYVGLRPEEVRPMARRLGIGDHMDSYPDALSTGMKRRASFLRAIHHPADVVLLDEPFKGLDDELRLLLADEIRARSRSAAVLLVDHDRELVVGIADDSLQLPRE